MLGIADDTGIERNRMTQAVTARLNLPDRPWHDGRTANNGAGKTHN